MEEVLPRTRCSEPPVIDGSRFCQLNCFQEALVPVLREFPGLTGFPFDTLRLIGPAEATHALRAGAVPGLFGGLSREDMARTFAITWRHAPAGATRPAAVRVLLHAGPVLLAVDRFDLSSDERWYRTAHRPHTILVVGADQHGIRYLDSDHPVTPATATWADLPAGDHAHPPVGVASARPPAGGVRVDPGLLRTVLTEPIDNLLRLCHDWTREAYQDPAVARTTGLDAVAYLNAVSRSAETAAGLVRDRLPGLAGRALAAVAAADLACRRLIMLLNSPNERRETDAATALDGVSRLWADVRREAATGWHA